MRPGNAESEAPTPAELLAAAGDLPRHEARRLLAKATGRDGHALLMLESVDGAAAGRFRTLVRRRRAGVPLQYLEGTVQFGPIELLIDPRALIPRPETEQLWELVVRHYDGMPQVVVDLCTGSGNLALACKWAWPRASVIAVDASPDAAELAGANVAFTGLDVEVLVGDLFAPLPDRLRGAVDVLVANPPYLGVDEVASLPVEVRDHEPRAALVAGAEGDEVVRRIAEGAPRWVRPGGLVACEISEFRTTSVEAAFAPLKGEILPDLTGRPRFAVGRVPVHPAVR